MPFTELANSTFLDFDSYRSAASVPSNGSPLASFAFNVALVFDRANDPTALLAGSWVSASATSRPSTTAARCRRPTAPTRPTTTGSWPTSPRSGSGPRPDRSRQRLCVVGGRAHDLDPGRCGQLHHPVRSDRHGEARHHQSGNTTRYWDGNLSLPSEWVETLGVHGLWFDTSTFKTCCPTRAAARRLLWRRVRKAPAMPPVRA